MEKGILKDIGKSTLILLAALIIFIVAAEIIYLLTDIIHPDSNF